MSTVLMCTVLVVGLIFLLAIEYFCHLRNLQSIPIRIHVNGSRGKSSVTRLIAAGLREHGYKTLAKTTGTLPRMIIEDGTEYPIFRPTRPNIIEQVRIMAFASLQKAEALVIECMALQPSFQTLTELQLVRATHGVITNVRPDHLDVMGPTEKDVALALLGTVPPKGRLFTGENDYQEEFRKACLDRQCELVMVSEEDWHEVSDQEIEGFHYLEHKENVALAIKVCQSLGVKRETALRGMWKAAPDPGAMSEYKLSFFGRDLVFINGFAANDAESSQMIWHLAIDRHPGVERRVMVINTRADRLDRSRQIGESLASWFPAHAYLIIGTGTYQLIRTAINHGLHPAALINAEGMSTEWLFEKIIRLAGSSGLIMGIGNIADQGMKLVTYFLNRAVPEK